MTPDQDMIVSEERLRENLERMKRSSEFLRQGTSPPAPISNTVRQSIADALDEGIEAIAELLALRSNLKEQEPVAFIPQADLDRLAKGGTVDCRMYRERTGSRFVVPLYASPPSPVSRESVTPDLIEQWLIAAYARGVEWNEENPLDREYRFKAAADWADNAMHDPETSLCRALSPTDKGEVGK